MVITADIVKLSYCYNVYINFKFENILSNITITHSNIIYYKFESTMVLFVKGSNNINIAKLCRLMINIEKNKNEYNMDGTLNVTKTAKKSFNKYIYNQIEFDATVSCGFLIIYSDNFNMTEFIELLSTEFNNNFTHDNSYYPSYTKSYSSTQHTMIMSKHIGNGTTTLLKHKRSALRFLTTNMSKITEHLETGVRFVWYIHHATEKLPYLQIQELCGAVPSKMYLMRSISTIIYDSINIFKVKPNLKQLNYPSINQLTQNLQTIKIRINPTYGLDYEILSAWVGYIDPFIVNIDKRHKRNKRNIKFSHYKICKVDEKVTYYSQLCQELSKPFNLEEYNKSELPNDICFISRSPLYGKVYILEFSRTVPLELNAVDDLDELVVANGPPELDNDIKCHIAINAYAFHILYENKSLQEYLIRKYKIAIDNIYISEYPRTELAVIDMIPDDSITKVKKNIMRCISKNGACSQTSIYNTKKIITYDAKNNIIYLGVCDYIYVASAHIYRNTNTVLFSWEI